MSLSCNSGRLRTEIEWPPSSCPVGLWRSQSWLPRSSDLEPPSMRSDGTYQLKLQRTQLPTSLLPSCSEFVVGLLHVKPTEASKSDARCSRTCRITRFYILVACGELGQGTNDTEEYVKHLKPLSHDTVLKPNSRGCRENRAHVSKFLGSEVGAFGSRVQARKPARPFAFHVAKGLGSSPSPSPTRQNPETLHPEPDSDVSLV